MSTMDLSLIFRMTKKFIIPTTRFIRTFEMSWNTLLPTRWTCTIQRVLNLSKTLKDWLNNNRENFIFSRRLSKNIVFGVENLVVQLVFDFRSIFPVVAAK